VDRTNVTLSQRAHDWPLAVVEVYPERGDESMVTWAVAVYESPEGLAWVEPHYIDPWATRSAAHAFGGAVHWDRVQARLDGHKPCLVRQPTEREWERAEAAQRAWSTWVEEQGRTEGEEHARLLDELQGLEFEVPDDQGD
jgi:hypothetical protein